MKSKASIESIEETKVPHQQEETKQQFGDISSTFLTIKRMQSNTSFKSKSDIFEPIVEENDEHSRSQNSKEVSLAFEGKYSMEDIAKKKQKQLISSLGLRSLSFSEGTSKSSDII